MAQVTFVQRSISAQSPSGTQTTTVTGHTSAAVGDLQVMIVANATQATPGGTGWVQNWQTATTNQFSTYFSRVVTADNLSEAQGTMGCLWSDIGRFEVRTYRNASFIELAATSLSLTSTEQTIPAEAMLLRSINSGVASATARTLTANASLVNSSGGISFSWYAGLSAGDEPGAALTVAPARVHTISSTASTPSYISSDVRVMPPQDVSGLTINNLTQHILAQGRITATWTAISGVTHYEYTVDDGPAVSVPTATLTTPPGLTYNSIKSLKVRGVSSTTSTATPWAEISATVGARYEDSYNTNPIGTRITVGSNGGTWSWDSATTSLIQTNSGLVGYAAFESIMPRSAPGYFEMSAEVTLTTDPAARKHIGLFPQGVDGNAISGYRVVNLDGAWEASRYTNNALTGVSNLLTHAPGGWNVGETKVLRMKMEGTSFTLWVNEVKTLTWTDATYNSLRPGYFSYGATSRFNTLTYVEEPVLSNTLQVSGLFALPYGGGAFVSWSASTDTGVTSYQYRVDGGTPVPLTSTSVKITGLTNGTQYNVEVRPANNNSQGGWRSILITPNIPYVFDDFERANVVPSTTALGTPVSGPDWTQPTGSLGILSGAVYSTTVAENLATVPAAFNVDITGIAQGLNYEVGYIFRYRDSSNYWLLQQETSVLPARLYRRVAGTFVLVNSYTGTSVTGSRLRIIAVNQSIVVYVNGRPVMTQDDVFATEATDTFAGLRQSATTGRNDLIHVQLANTATLESVGSLTNAVDSGNISTTDAQTSHVYKGRDTKDLDTIGAA